jgi:hypothetical protein
MQNLRKILEPFKFSFILGTFKADCTCRTNGVEKNDTYFSVFGFLIQFPVMSYSYQWNQICFLILMQCCTVTQLRSIHSTTQPITVAAQSRAWTVFALSNAGFVGSNPTRGMDVCMYLFCVCVVLCVGRDIATGWSPVQGVLPTVYRIKKLKKRPRPNKGL